MLIQFYQQQMHFKRQISICFYLTIDIAKCLNLKVDDFRVTCNMHLATGNIVRNKCTVIGLIKHNFTDDTDYPNNKSNMPKIFDNKVPIVFMHKHIE